MYAYVVCLRLLLSFGEKVRERERVCVGERDRDREREGESESESNLPGALGNFSIYDQRSIPNSFCSHRKLSEAAQSKIDGRLERASERARARQRIASYQSVHWLSVYIVCEYVFFFYIFLAIQGSSVSCVIG